MKESYKYNNFTYEIDYSKKGLKGFDISHNKTKPESIYKYYSISNYSVDAILKGYFYASHPLELNDHLDSSNFLLGSSEQLKFEYYESFMSGVYNSKEELETYYKNDSVGNDGFYAKGFITNLWQILSDKFGIISLTSKDKNNLMWPHYTQEKGIQVKFNTIELEKSMSEKIGEGEGEECLGLYPMNYSQDLSPIDISDFNKFYVPFLYITNVKSKSWQYEDEWRFIISKKNMGIPYSKAGLDPRQDHIVDKANRRAFYDKSIVEEVTLGNNFFTSREFIIDRKSNEEFTVIPIESDNNWNFKNHCKLLGYIECNLKDKLFYSGKCFHINEKGIPVLKRTKERLEIELIGDNKYSFTRTNEFY